MVILVKLNSVIFVGLVFKNLRICTSLVIFKEESTD